MVVVDPPFITHEVWKQYAITSKLLLKQGSAEDGSPLGKCILTTVLENADLLKEILGAKATVRYNEIFVCLLLKYKYSHL